MPEQKSWVEIVLMPLVVAFVGILGTHLITSQQQQSVEIKAVEDRQIKILEIFAEKITSSDEGERIFALRLLGAVDNDLAAKLANAVSETENKPTAVRRVAEQVVIEAEARAASQPRIYLHIQDELNREIAQKVGEELRHNSFSVPSIEFLVDGGPQSSQLRYFRKSEEEQAEHIVEILKSTDVDVKIQYIGGYENSTIIQPQHYELWFASGEP